ncbi:hypothetical protein L6452_15335 [Arctium lappa]|uniref:Uncharacterized protein n=1 Tax=Arctium lappa TaxID=4217 RepID=A0ACB9CNE9_ARCLA|nr:hypothetical protein L6452_15335 [Arctium lappa]
MFRSNPAIPRILSWPQVQDCEMLYLQKQKKSFTFSMTIPYGLIANYADMTDDSVINYCLENEFVEAEQEEPSHGTPSGTIHEEQGKATSQEIDTVVATTLETDVDLSAVPQDVATHQVESIIAVIEVEATTVTADIGEDVNPDETGVANDDETNVDLSDDGENSTSDSDDDDDDDDADQPSMKVYDQRIRTPEVVVVSKYVSEDKSVPIDISFAQTSTQTQSQAPASFSVEVTATTVSAVELSMVPSRVSSEKFTTLNEVIRQFSERVDAKKEEDINNLKSFFKGKMPEIDTSVLPPEIPFRRPSGVIIREPSSAVSSSTSPIVSLPFPSIFTQSAGISMSAPTDTSSRASLHDAPISELSDLLYARLLSMSLPQHQDQDFISLLRNFQSTPPPVSSSSSSDRINALSHEFQELRSEVRSSLSDLRSFMAQLFSDLSNKIDHLDQSCRTEVGPSLKRRQHQDDPDHQGHEGEMAKRQRTEGSSEAREVVQEEVAGDREKTADTVQDCSIHDLVNVMIANADVTALHNEFNLSEANIDSMQIVVYVDPDVSGRAHEVEESEAANGMRSFFANFIEITSDDDEEVRFEKVAQVKEEDCNNIIILSNTEDDTVFMDASDTKEVELLNADLPSQVEIPEVDQPSSTPVTSSAPTTNIPSSAFEVGQSSKA